MQWPALIKDPTIRTAIGIQPGPGIVKEHDARKPATHPFTWIWAGQSWEAAEAPPGAKPPPTIPLNFEYYINNKILN